MPRRQSKKSPRKITEWTQDELYRDYAMVKQRMGDRTFTAVYTPWGIRELDTSYCNRIRAAQKHKESLEYLREIIRIEYHLHPAFRRNLLSNIRTYLAQIK